MRGTNQVIGSPGYLFVVPWSLRAVGGVSVAVQSLAGAMGASGVLRPLVLVLDWASARVTKVADSDQETWSLRIPAPFPFNQRGLLHTAVALSYRLPIALFRFAELLKRENVVCVNFHYPGLECLAPLVLRVFGIYRGRVLLSFHGQDIVDLRQDVRRSTRLLWRWAFERADALVACSHGLANELRELAGGRGRVVVVSNGVDCDSIRRLAASVPPEIARRYVICLATYEWKKGLDVLLDAFAAIATESPDVDLVLSGRSAGELEPVRARAQLLGIALRVRILTDTPHGDAIRLLARATLLVLPSRREPFGLVVLEAAALGIPVVMSSACGVAEVIPHDLVTQVPVADAHALASAMADVLVNAGGAELRARSLQRFVEERLSWAASVAQYVALSGASAKVSA
jgi:L-malate glycosyltransferase